MGHQVVPDLPKFPNKQEVAKWLLKEAGVQICGQLPRITHVTRIFSRGQRMSKLHAVITQQVRGKPVYLGLVCSYSDQQHHEEFSLLIGTDRYSCRRAIYGQGDTRWVALIEKVGP